MDTSSGALVAAPRDRAHLWPPFMSSEHFENETVPASQGEGQYILDDQGRRYLDSISGLWHIPFGYSNRTIKSAIIEQLERLPGHSLITGSNAVAQQFAAALAEMSRGSALSHAFLSSGGAEAIETAIKATRHYFRSMGQPSRRVILSFGDSYHGMTYGALSLTGFNEDRDGFEPLLSNIQHVGSSSLLRGGNIGLAHLKDSLVSAVDQVGADKLAAIIFEPVFAVAGMLETPRELLELMADLREKTGALLIADEVTTGMGRLGRFLSVERFDFAPDIVVMGKALTNGYVPVGATLFSERFASRVCAPGQPAFMHGYTFSGNPLAAAAGVATLRILSEEYPAERLLALGGELQSAMAANLGSNRFVAGLRTIGLLGAVDLDLPIPHGQDPAIVAGSIRRACRAMGVIVRPTYGGTTFNFAPMFIATRKDFDQVFATFSEAVERVGRSIGREG